MSSQDILYNSTTTTTVVTTTSLERIGAHSHIRGLGLNDSFESVHDGNDCNMIGQFAARKALGVVWRMLQQQQQQCNNHGNRSRMTSQAGRAVLLAGPPSTGKTALAMGLAQELQRNQQQRQSSRERNNSNSNINDASSVPFVYLSASQVYCLGVSKTEALTQAVRQAMSVHIQEETELIVGEVVEIQIDSYAMNPSSSTTAAATASGMNAGGVVTRAGRLTLCTTEMETVYDLGNKMLDMLRQEKITAGDVIQIDKAASGKITKLGRSMSRSRDYDAVATSVVSSSTKFVQTPEGELQQRRTVTHTVSLHEMDVINSRQQGFLALFTGETGEIATALRQQIDHKVQSWREEGRCTTTAGVLFVDEIHLLDQECFSFLNVTLEQSWAPAIVMATNRGWCRIRGTAYHSPHGIPLDLLDRCMIIPTTSYTPTELQQILKVRCREEEVDMEATALELLTRIATETSLRYAMHLIIMSHLSAARRLRKQGTAVPTTSKIVVTIPDVQVSYRLFLDAQRSTKLLVEYQDAYLFNELGSNGMIKAGMFQGATAAAMAGFMDQRRDGDSAIKSSNSNSHANKDEETLPAVEVPDVAMKGDDESSKMEEEQDEQ